MTALDTINKHYQVIIAKNAIEICNKYVDSPNTYVVLEGPRLTTLGYQKIETGWQAFCNSTLTLNSINWVEGPFVDEHETMAWVAGIIDLEVAIEKNGTINKFTNTFRSSFVLVKNNGKWQIKHEHVSVVHPDPYGIGDWLQKK